MVDVYKRQVSLGAASFTFAAVRGQMTDCRITEKTIVGDAAAAAGLSASFGMGLQNQLYWRNVYTYGGADDGADVQETAFSRKNPFPADKKGPVPYVRLENMTAGGDVPVSYTHLDVYKRQSLHKGGAKKGGRATYAVYRHFMRKGVTQENAG